jgi:putative heme-binding domain-containing protein
MSHATSRITAFFLCICLNAAGALAADPPVRNGLVLWLDASAQSAARQAAALPALGRLQPVDLLLDTSGTARNAVQPLANSRPTYISDGEVGYLKFDGKDDFLAIYGPRKLTPELTVFILAAPKANPGNFSALFATTESARNDYTSGLNLDFGPAATNDLSVINVESGGTTGFRDLLVPGVLNAAERPFGGFHVFTVRSRIGKGGDELFLDGFKGGDRDRLESMIGLDQMAIGSRIYSNDPAQPPHAQGFFNGAIAEVLVYERALTDSERQSVEQTLLAKTVGLHALASGAKGHPLESVQDPPVVQMLVPGFTVHELPLKIGNINNVRYRDDGKVVALGYDGRIHLLSDTNGDGLEDRDELFWDKTTMRGPIGMALMPKNDPRGEGVIVASKGKVSFFIDRDHDGRADEEKIIATGWKESFHSVDTLGVAIDPKDGAIYFGLGTVNFADPYLIDKATGRAAYDIHDAHGTIQRLSADFARRETICTGVRFTCALAFNRAGDLFATEQEGATWLPNGNPLDELLHIEPGKHYGFPPRHPKHLPDVRDEPAVIEYGPQHQSAVGMVFNEGVNGGPSFGPAHWQGDAIVCGESRGKIWRTKLAKTPLGYIAQNHLVACLALLTVDACITPAGDLLVACHSGPPDWGTGPAGEGRLFKIRFTGRDLPQPVQTWASAPDEFRIAFDRPLVAAEWAHAKEQVKIEAGAYVSAGDRFEVVRPGYQVVRDQMATPRRWIDLLGLTLTEDQRTLVLRVPRQTQPAHFAITLPLPEAWRQRGGIAQHAQIDVATTLNGIAARVTGADGKTDQTILPHPSLDAAKIFTHGSSEQERFVAEAMQPGAKLSLDATIDVSNPFVPAVQPGSQLDWDLAADPFAATQFAVQSDYAGDAQPKLDAREPRAPLRKLETFSVEVSAPHGNGLFLAHETLRHPLNPTRLFVPWMSETQPAPTTNLLVKTRTDVKGNWLRGRRLFFGEAGCAACHTLRGEGLAFGPDLTNLIHRDRQSVITDITKPSATINPDQAGSLVELKDGASFPGIIRSFDQTRLILAGPGGVQSEFPRAAVVRATPLKTSLMPEGLAQTLTGEKLEDLLTFLLINPLEPAPIIRTEPPTPPARRMSEVNEILGLAASAPREAARPLKLLVCSGPKDHGQVEHDYPLWLDRWSRLLPLAENVTVDTATGFPSEAQLRNADVAIFYNANPGWNAEHAAALDAYHQRGGGAVYLHYAVDGGKDPDGVAERMGFAFTLGSRFRHGEFDLVFKEPRHPITRGLPTLHFTDETYWAMRGQPGRLHILGTAVEENEPRPELWTLERAGSRIVACIPGHYTWTFDDPLYRILVLRSICWAAKLDDAHLDRLAELAVIGARVAP